MPQLAQHEATFRLTRRPPALLSMRTALTDPGELPSCLLPKAALQCRAQSRRHPGKRRGGERSFSAPRKPAQSRAQKRHLFGCMASIAMLPSGEDRVESFDTMVLKLGQELHQLTQYCPLPVACVAFPSLVWHPFVCCLDRSS